MALHPDCARYLEDTAAWFKAEGLPPFWEMAPDRARKVFHDAIIGGRPALPAMAVVEDRQIPTPGGDRPVRILRPTPVSAGPLPVIVYYFGGGYVIGGIDESEHESRRLAQRTPAVVIAVGYRLAPEHRFPAAIDDAYAAARWAAEHAGEFGGDACQLAVSGNSAGGGLAAAVSRLSVRQGPRIALTLLLCPWLELTMERPSVARYARGYDLDREFLDWFAEAYVGGTGKARDELASPGLHPIPAGHPATIILAAECDPLFDEARDYANRLQAAGVETTCIEADGMIHAFNELNHLIPAAETHLARVERATRRYLQV
jgi:acetyl esterase